jgi:AraC-like DNA-binding protein
MAARDTSPYPMDSDMLGIYHCREGRFEFELPWGECGYFGDGDLVIRPMALNLSASTFPLAHYHGIAIVMDVARAQATFEKLSPLLGIEVIEIRKIRERFLGKNPYYIMRGSDAVQHILSELYSAPDALKESYIRLKLIELFLFLSVAKPDDTRERKYFYRTRVDAVRAMHEYMAAHLDNHLTLDELSERFNIPLTAMKNCFKSVFGAPIHTYMREYRLQTAAALLRETDEPIAKISERVGYDSHAQFSSAFKSSAGMSPSKYRKVSV